VATITGASFNQCVGDLGAASGCTLTATGTNFPWRATALTTTNIQIHGLDIDIRFETAPGGATCNQNGVQARLTGTVSGVVFTPGAAGSRRLDFAGATGVTAHLSGLTLPAAFRGSAVGTGLLNVLD
jgi:hypothetical protein